MPGEESLTLPQTEDVDPSAFYAQVEEAGGIAWDADASAWIVSSYDLIKAIGKADDDVWRSPLVAAGEQRPFGLDLETWTALMGFGSRHSLFLSEGESRERVHHWLRQALGSGQLEDWNTRDIEPIVADALRSCLEGGRAELCSEFTDVIGPRMMCAVLGLPADADWITRVTALSGRRNAVLQYAGADGVSVPRELIDDALAASSELAEMLMPFVLDGRGDAGTIIGMLWRDAPSLFGESFEPIDLVAQVLSVFEGGADTTAAAAANGLYVLARDADLQERLRQSPDLAPGFAEEALRLFGTVMFRPRIANRDTTVGSVGIKKGEVVVALLGAGGRDPERYAMPQEIDLERPRKRSHLAFFMGPRICPGNVLARRQLTTIFSLLVQSVGDLELDPDAPSPHFEGYILRRWSPLHATFVAA